MTFADELLSRRTVTPEGCWELEGQRHRRYGQIRTKVYAHRLAYQTWVGPIPAGMLVCHRCDNPPCYNPAHLFLGSKSDNLLDAAAKGIWKPSARQEYCQRGHLLAGANLYERVRVPGRAPRRSCAECHRETVRRYKAKRRAQVTDAQDRAASERLARAIG